MARFNRKVHQWQQARQWEQAFIKGMIPLAQQQSAETASKTMGTSLYLRAWSHWYSSSLLRLCSPSSPWQCDGDDGDDGDDDEDDDDDDDGDGDDDDDDSSTIETIKNDVNVYETYFFVIFIIK